MTLKICVIMDPVSTIQVKKDTTVAILQEAQKRQWEIYYLEPKDLFLLDNKIYCFSSQIKVQNDTDNWVTFLDSSPQKRALKSFDAVLLRKDPPFDNAYLYTTYLLEIAQNQGTLIVNNPKSVRDANEKLYTAWFPACCPQTLVTSNYPLIREFLNQYDKIIVKKINSMGGDGVFSLTKNHPNINVTLEMLTHKGKYPIMAQRYIPEISKGDKRVLLIDGKPYPYALLRIPHNNDFRGNLAAGATGKGSELTKRDLWICEQLGPTLSKKGLFFVGLDIIGDYLSEINVTSPTCVREIEAAFNVNICAEILDRLNDKIADRKSR